MEMEEEVEEAEEEEEDRWRLAVVDLKGSTARLAYGA